MKYIFTNGHILDGTKDMKVLDGHSVLVEDDKITGIVKGNTVPDGFKEINLEGKYLMPGLINMHVHLAGNGKPQKKQRDNEKTVKLLMGTALSRAVTYNVVKDFAKTELMSGVTTIRTVGGLADFDTRVRDDIRNGKADGPRILAANEGISVPGGHMAGSVAVAANNIDEALVQVDIAKSQNVDLIKLMITGGVLDAKAKGVPGELKMKPEMVKAVCDKAHALGYKVAAHVESPEGVRVALENGVDSIEHGAKPDDEIIHLFKENNAFYARHYHRLCRMHFLTEVFLMRQRLNSIMVISCLRESKNVLRQLLRMIFRLFLVMMLDVHGLHSMISGENCIISTNMSA